MTAQVEGKTNTTERGYRICSFDIASLATGPTVQKQKAGMIVSGEMTVAASSYRSTLMTVALRIMIGFLNSRIFMQGLSEIVLTGIDDEIVVPERWRLFAALAQEGLHGGNALVLHQFFHRKDFGG